jgi:cell wall-associated NlpC family hydrolase
MRGQGSFFTRTRRQVGALVAAVAIGGVIVLGAPDAGSQTLEEKRAEAEQVAARIADLEAEHATLEEDARVATDELADAEARVAEVEAELAELEAERDARSDELASYSVDAYVGGPAQDEVSAMLQSETGDLPVRLGYLGTVAGDRNQLLEELAAAEEDVQIRVDELADAQAEAADLLDQIEQSRSEAEATLAEQRQIEESLDAEIASLVAEQQAAAAAAAQAQAEQQAAAAATSGGGGGGGGDTGGGGSGGGGYYTGPPPSVSPGAAGAVQAARSMIGVPYQWGGSSPSTGFDCSGLTSWAWAQAGRSIPRTSRAQFAGTRRVSLSDLQPGDLVFYGSPIYHVGLYTGGGMMVDAPSSGRTVNERSIYAVGTPVGAGRP